MSLWSRTYRGPWSIVANRHVARRHDNAAITSAQNESNDLFQNMLSVQPRSTSGGGKSRDQIIKEKAEDLLARIPPNIPMVRAWSLLAAVCMFRKMRATQQGQQWRIITTVTTTAASKSNGPAERLELATITTRNGCEAVRLRLSPAHARGVTLSGLSLWWCDV